MHPDYHNAIIESALYAAREHVASEGWAEVTLEREGASVFATFVGAIAGDRYLARIDMARFPVEPYEVGFIKPETPRSDWLRVSDRDARYWPWSPMPALNGSFVIAFPRALRVFWCRDCTTSFFYIHGHEEGRRWSPHAWQLTAVISELRTAVLKAVHQRHWRYNQRPRLVELLAGAGISLPPNAAIDDA